MTKSRISPHPPRAKEEKDEPAQPEENLQQETWIDSVDNAAKNSGKMIASAAIVERRARRYKRASAQDNIGLQRHSTSGAARAVLDPQEYGGPPS